MIETIEQEKVLKAQEHWRNYPVEFSKSFFNSFFWDKQIEIFNAIRDYKRVVVKSGNTIGKSRIASDIILWFLITHYPSKVIITAPTFTQVEEILWKEISKLYHKSNFPLGGDLLNTELKFNEEWFALGISTDEVNRFQGFHSQFLLMVLDEACGISPMIWEAIEALHPYKILAIGNPLESSGDFFNCFNSDLWHKISVSCLECVEWQEKNRAIPGLVTRQWIEERKEDWGVKSPLYQARVLGEFPQEGIDTLIPMRDVDKAKNIQLDEEEDAIKIISSDIATKHGSNYTVILYRKGHTILDIDIKQGIPTTMTAQNIQHTYEKKEGDSIVIDSDGIGEGVGDMLIAKKLGVLEFHGGYASKAMDSTRFKNLRSQFYWVMAKKFEKGLYSLKELPKDIFEKLKSQLCSIKVKPPDSQGRIQIETKEDMLARGLVSPDIADALMMSEYAYYMGKMSELRPYAYR